MNSSIGWLVGVDVFLPYSAANSARISVPRISYSFPTNAVLGSYISANTRRVPPLPPLFPRFPPQERRTSDVAVTNYLGLHQRDGEKERERSPPRPPLVDPSPPLAASPRGISPLLLHSPPPLLYFSPRLGISAEPNGTLIWTSSPAFVLPLRVYRYTRGHCFAPVRPNSRRGLAHRPY